MADVMVVELDQVAAAEAGQLVAKMRARLQPTPETAETAAATEQILADFHKLLAFAFRRGYMRCLDDVAAFEARAGASTASPSMAELRGALEESVKLQSHYATLLNAHDGGQRRTFTVESWLERIRVGRSR